MAETRLYLIPVGLCDLHESVIKPDDYQDRRLIVPIWSYLIRTPDVTILVDTGMPPECLQGPVFPGDRIKPVMTAADLVTAKLGEIGVAPGDLDMIVNTHLHFDHAGGNGLFPDRTITLQRVEYEAAQRGEAGPWCKLGSVNLLDGDAELAPGVQAIFTPGHSVGHTSLLVRTREPILLTVDASYTAETFDPERLGAMRDKAAGAASVRRLQEIARDAGARIFFGHDLEQGKQWRRAPEYYV